MRIVPDLGVYHPQIIHFVIALLGAGVVFRLVSLTGKLQFTDLAATVLLLGGTVAAWLAVDSGLDAHEAVEQIPGTRAAVVEHEDWGKRTRNLFLVVAALEVAGLVIRRKKNLHKGMLAASAVVGLVGLAFIYETAEHGGELVYAYAGGVGVRSGDPQDVQRLYLAALYEQAMQDRRNGKADDAARLFDELASRFPNDAAVQFLAIQSRLTDRHDPAAALAGLRAYEIPPDNRGMQYRAGLLAADAFTAMNQPDSARAALQTLLEAFPGNRRIQQRLDQLK